MKHMPPPKTSVPPELAAALADVRLRFIDGLIPLINDMEFRKQDLGDPAKAAAAIAGLRYAAHKVSGMAGSVGFPLLGQKAGELDITLSAMMQAPHNARAVAALDEPLEELLDMMEAALDAE